MLQQYNMLHYMYYLVKQQITHNNIILQHFNDFMIILNINDFIIKNYSLNIILTNYMIHLHQRFIKLKIYHPIRNF